MLILPLPSSRFSAVVSFEDCCDTALDAAGALGMSCFCVPLAFELSVAAVDAAGISVTADALLLIDAALVLYENNAPQ